MTMYKFKEKISNFEVCLTTDYNDWYILPTELIDDIASGIRDGKWYTILGPPRCQKSFLLKSISSKLQHDKPSVIVDLKELPSYQHADLLGKFCILIRDHLNKLNLSTCTCFDGEIRSVNQVVIKLKECLSIIRQDLVLFIDHIEEIKIRPLMLLFDVFENIYRTQKENDPYKLTLVLASSFIVPSMAQKQPPIPEFAEVILIQDLCPDANKILLDCFAEINTVEITDNARKLCIDYASDDREVICKLLQYAYFHSQSEDHPTAKLPIRERDVQKAIDWFIKHESKSYVPLIKTIRAIENSPSIMLYVLRLIESGSFSLKYPGHATDPQIKVEPLLFTGAVREKINEDGSCEYIIRNKIYQRCLEDYFDLDRIVNILITSGNWDWAIDYLEKNSKDIPAVNVKLLETIVSSIYVAKAEERAYQLLLRALTNVFKISKVRIYIINTAQTNFMMVSTKGPENYPRTLSVEEQSTPEIQAYLCKDYIVDIPKDKNKDGVLIMPLLKDEDNVFGLVAMHNFMGYGDEFRDLLSFLKRSGKAIGTVIERQRTIINRIDKQAKRYDLLKETETFQILHISDLHINDTEEDKFDRSVVLERLIERVKQDQKNNFHPEIIVVTGDIAFKGIKAEYYLGKIFFDDLLAALALENNRLFIVPGNHDVNRKEYRPTEVLQYANIRELNKELENYRKDLLKGMVDYFDFTETHLAHLKSIHGRLVPFVNTFDAKCGKRIGLVGLNSAWMCRKSPDERTVAIGEFQVKTAMEELKKKKGEIDLQVVLFHHPLDWLWPPDRKICRKYLDNSILLSGHLHDVEGGYLNDLNGSIYQFQSGGAYLGTESDLPCRFHYITLDWGANKIRLDFRRFVKDQHKWSVDGETGDDGQKVFKMIGG
jgi:predicted MPP superfamily phosphohydrolase